MRLMPLRDRLTYAVVAIAVIGVAILFFLGRDRVQTSSQEAKRPTFLAGESRVDAVRLYFGDPNQVALRAETRLVAADPNLEARIIAAIRELASGSLTGGLSVLPADASLRRAFVDRWGIAYLDFNDGIDHGRRLGDGSEWLMVAGVVRTVCDNFPEVRAVRFLVNGELVSSLRGSIDLEEPLSAAQFPSTAN